MSDLWQQIAALSPEKRELLERLLREEGLSPAAAAQAGAPPSTGAEAAMARLWAEVLGRDSVGVDQSFFSLGGDSIQCMQVVARARREGFAVTTQMLFDHPTVSRLVAAAGEPAPDCASSPAAGGAPGEPPLEAEELKDLLRRFPEGDVEDVYALTPAQEGMLFHVLADKDPALYRDQGICTLRGDIDPGAFLGAWQRLVDRHPALRTSFHWQGLSRPVQVVHRRVAVPFLALDWRGVTPPAAAALVSERLAVDLARPTNLTTPPLFELTLARTAQDTCQLLWTHHHLAHDAWSLQLLVGELLALYAEERGGAPAALAPAPLYRDYVVWLLGRDGTADAPYWRETLRPAGRPTPLPGREPDSNEGTASPPGLSVQGGAFQQRESALPADLRDRLDGFARANGLTLATLFHAAWALELATGADQSDVTFGTVVAGRPLEIPGAEAMVGLFINTLPLRVPLPPDRALLGWLLDLQAAMVELRRHEHTPLGRIANWLNQARTEPLFETVVVVQNVFTSLPDGPSSGITIDRLRLLGHSNYPLMLRVTPAAEVRLELLFDTACVEPAAGDRLLARHAALLEAFVGAATSTPVADLLAAARRLRVAEREGEQRQWRETSRQRLRALRSPQDHPAPERAVSTAAAGDGSRTGEGESQ